jgi:hypothetical protein
MDCATAATIDGHSQSSARRPTLPLIATGVAMLIGMQAAQGEEATADSAPVVAVQPNPAGQPLYRLEYKLQAGQTIYYDIMQKAKIITQKEGKAETTQNESNTRMHFRVLSVAADGQAELESSIDHVKMSYSFGGGDPITYDSQNDRIPPRGFGGVKESIGRPLARLKVEKSGKLVSAISLRGENAEDKNDVSDDPARNYLVPLPTEPVAVGATWTQQLSVRVRISRNLTNKVTLLRKYEFASIEGHVATIRVKTGVVTPVDDPQILMQLIQRTPQGTIRLDLEQGLIVSRISTTDKTELGVLGPNSSMQAVSELKETLVPAPTVAAKP